MASGHFTISFFGLKEIACISLQIARHQIYITVNLRAKHRLGDALPRYFVPTKMLLIIGKHLDCRDILLREAA